MKIQELYTQWCKQTKRSGGILVGGFIQEFFTWLDNNDYYIAKNAQYSDSFMETIASIDEAMKDCKSWNKR